MDWKGIIAFSVNPWEIVLRGTLMYWFLFVVIVASASQSAMSGDSKTVADGFLLVGTPVFWNFFFDFISYQSVFIRRITEPLSVLLVHKGKLLLRNMRREYITRTEMQAKMREQGIEELNKIKEMQLESDGTISVIRSE